MNFFKKNFPKWMLPLLPLAVSGQSLHVTQGGNLILSGGVDVVLNNIALTNDGTITPAKSTILFTGDAPVSVTGLGGTANTSLNNVTINKAPGTEMQLNGDVGINGNLNMVSGNLQLNGHRITMSLSGKIVGEGEQSYITGTDSALNGGIVIIAQVPANKPTNPMNVGVEITVPATGFISLLRQHIARRLPDGRMSIQRVFTINSSIAPPINASLKFFYLDHELNGNEENPLNLYKISGTPAGFKLIGKDSSDQVANWVRQDHLDSLGIFTLVSIQPIGAISPRTGLSAQGASITPASLSPLAGLPEPAVTVYPNPAHDHFTMVITSHQVKEVIVNLYNVSGNLLQQKAVYCQLGANKLSWDLSKLPAGNYYLSIEGLDVKNVKVVKQ